MRRLLFVLAAMALLFSCREKEVPVIATVGEYHVRFDDYVKRYSEYLFTSAMKDNLVTRKQVAQNMVHELLLKYYDDNSALEKNPEYKKELAWARNQMILGYLKDQEVYARITADDREVRRAFARSKEKIAARHLYAPTREEAERLYKELLNGADFDELARRTFTDSTLRSNGGYLGYFSWGDMDPVFEDTAYSLQPGEISHPVKTAQGYSIIKVEDRKPAPLITENQYLNARRGIERILRINKKKPAEQAFLKKHFDETKLVFYNEGLSELVHALSLPGGESTAAARKVASYGRQIFTLADMHRELDRVPASLKASIVDVPSLKAVIKGLLIQKNLLEEAREKGYDRAPIVEEKVRTAYNNLFLKFKFNQVVQAYTVPDSILRIYYEEHKDEFRSPRRLAVSEILVAGEDEALELKGRLLQGEDFAGLARAYSLRRWSAEQGGRMGLADWQRFGLLRGKLWKAPLNRVVGPWQVRGMYGLFKVTRRLEPQQQPFDAVKDELIQKYKKDYEWKIMFIYLNDLYKKTEISYNNDLIKSFVLDEANDGISKEQ